MDLFIKIITGICFSAASGFRIFIPFLIIGIASYFGWADFGSSALWISNYPVFIIISVAAAVEVSGYYNPWIDNMLDLISTPLALFAGIILTASMISDINPVFKWVIAVIIGGGSSIYVQLLSVKARALSSNFSSGIGNPLIATIENLSSLIISILAVIIPRLSFLITIIIIITILKFIKVKKGSYVY